MAADTLPQPTIITPDMRVKMDIPYAPGLKSEPATRQALDLYAPHHGTNLPVIAYVHGGGWRYWDRKGVDLKPAAFIRNGYVFVSIGYRLVPEVRYREQCADVAQGLRWVRDHIAEYSGDPDRIHLLGFSAGAPMVALVISDPQYLQGAAVPTSAIRSVTGLDGDCYHIPRQLEMVDPRTREYHESVWGADPKGWADPSPITHLTPGHPYPPFLVVHISSRADSTWQANAFANRYREVGGNAQLCSIDATHLALNANIGRENDPATAVLLEFVAKHDKLSRVVAHDDPSSPRGRITVPQQEKVLRPPKPSCGLTSGQARCFHPLGVAPLYMYEPFVNALGQRLLFTLSALSPEQDTTDNWQRAPAIRGTPPAKTDGEHFG